MQRLSVAHIAEHCAKVVSTNSSEKVQSCASCAPPMCKIMQVQVISAITNCKIMVICQNKYFTIVGTKARCANM